PAPTGSSRTGTETFTSITICFFKSPLTSALFDKVTANSRKKAILRKGPCLKIPVQSSRSQLKCLVHVQKHEMQGEHYVEMKQKQNVLSVSQVVVAPKGDNQTSPIAHLFTTPVTDHPFQNHNMRRAATPTVDLPVAFIVAIELSSSSDEPTTTLSCSFARQPKLYCSIFFSAIHPSWMEMEMETGVKWSSLTTNSR
ncbi:hypothetical protein LB504_002694, partial [Fusarium proliferatum]